MCAYFYSDLSNFSFQALHLMMSFSTRLNRALLAESFAVCDSCFIVLPGRLKGSASSGYTYPAVAVVVQFMYWDLNKSRVAWVLLVMCLQWHGDQSRWSKLSKRLPIFFQIFFSWGCHAKLFQNSKIQWIFVAQNLHIVKVSALLRQPKEIRVKLAYLW